MCISSGSKFHGQSAASLLVLSKHDYTLAMVDPGTLQVAAKVPVGDDPHEVIASTDGTRAYVSSYGFGAFHTLAVVDLVAHRALPSIDLGALRGPHGLIYEGGKTWFTAESAEALGRYDPVTGKIDLIPGTGQNRTHMIWVLCGRSSDRDDKCELWNSQHLHAGTLAYARSTSGRSATRRHEVASTESASRKSAHAAYRLERDGDPCGQRLGRFRCVARQGGDLGRQCAGRHYLPFVLCHKR